MAVRSKKKSAVTQSSNRTGPSAAPRERTAFEFAPDTIERALLTGENGSVLQDYFGTANYQQMRDLAREASTRSVRGGPRVLILPGIMGSRLAKKGLLGLEDVLWVNPIEIAAGRLTLLKLNGAISAYHEAGAILLAYLKLKLRLRIAGFDADFFAYDWRLSLLELGQRLADAIGAETAPHLSLVAHSMGGLVARAALSASPSARDKVQKIVMLGTPNYGSFAPAQAFRGSYDVVQKLAWLDQNNSVDELAGQVFNTFPGLYEMLPSPTKFSKVDLYDVLSWPKKGPGPLPKLLKAVKPVVDQLAPADSRFFLIAGINQETVIGLTSDGNEFQYEVSRDGDGTVPTAFARLAGIPEAQTYYVEENHGSLPNNGAVERAVIDLLSLGKTTVLSLEPPPVSRSSRIVSEDELKEMALRSSGIGELGSADYRNLLDSVAAPPGVGQSSWSTLTHIIGDGGSSAPYDPMISNPQIQNLIVGRRRQRQLEITLAHGSITDVDARAYVLGVFRNVAPSGAAKAVDQRLGGAVSDFTGRRMLSGDVGSVFTVPASRNQLPAEMVIFAGMGSFDQFNSDVQQLVAENAIRFLCRSRVNDLATVLLGIGGGQSVMTVLQHLLVGFVRGLTDSDPDQRFRRITICETDTARFKQMRDDLFGLVRSSVFLDIELMLNEIEVPSATRAIGSIQEAGTEPVYLMVREEEFSAEITHYRVSLLGAGMKASVVSATRSINKGDLASLLAEFDSAVRGQIGSAQVTSLGQQFANLVLPAEVCTVLESMPERELVVVHDAPTARIPWETLTINNWSPAVGSGLSRRYLADSLPMATWLEERRIEPILKLLLIMDPTDNLDGAEREGARIQELIAAKQDIEVTVLARGRATKMAIVTALRTGKYDCVHYAGHAFFDRENRGRSGLLCSDNEVLSSADLIGISNLPSLIFFNACETGLVRGANKSKGDPPKKSASVQSEESSGIAEALMRGGVATFLSTYWPVADNAARDFASTFYERLLAGDAIGSSLLKARKAIKDQRDWADYILYGDSKFVLKQKARQW